MQTRRHVLAQPQYCVDAQKALRHGDAPVGRVVQRSLQPLDGSGHRRVHSVGYHIAAERADAFTPHGIALIGHGGRADLIRLEGFLQLPVMLQKADIVSHAIGALGDAAETAEDAAVRLPGIGLSAYREAGGKAELRRDAAVHLVDLCLIAVKQVHEAGLCARGAPAAQEPQCGQYMVQLLHVSEKVLHPQDSAFAHGHGLCRLVVCIAQGGRVGIFFREGCQVVQHSQQLCAQIDKAIPVQDQVGVVGHIAAGGPQMEDPRRRRRRLAVGVYVCHHIVAYLSLPLDGRIIVDVGDMRLQLGDLRFGDGQT